MENIKFKAWDKINKKMITKCDLCNSLCIANSTGKYIFLKYIGIKDKNGIEICEHDVIEYPNTEKKICRASIRYNTTWAAYCMTYENSVSGNYESGTILYMFEDSERGRNFLKSIKIIGNIYEPKMLPIKIS